MKINYVGLTKRTVAIVIDGIIELIFMFLFLFFAAASSHSNDIQFDILAKIEETSIHPDLILLSVPFIILEILMTTRFGGSPGKLLCSMYVKDANTLQNVTLMQSAIRTALKRTFFIIVNILCICISGWCVLLSILVLMFAIFDQRKQTFYDKIAKTVVMNYKLQN